MKKSNSKLFYKKFYQRLPLFGSFQKQIEFFIEQQNQEIIPYLHFLYATLPLSDIFTYSPDFFLKFINHAIFLKKNIPFVKKTDEEIFLHYILYPRINTEKLADCRSLFYQKLIELTKNLSPKSCVIEVNYWCLKHVTYQTTDDRTSSPLNIFLNGIGRCGEESTFCVNVLRSIGIPARQVYAPLWSHCDDNHAWVEVFLDNQWFFLGACEPEPILNRGWFSQTATRAMLIFTRTFRPSSQIESPYFFQEDRITYENLTPFYSETCLLKLTILDSQHHPLKKAEVNFEILNMSEYYPIAKLFTNSQGQVSLHLGLGNILIKINYKNQYFTKLILLNKQQIQKKIIFSPPQIIYNQWQKFNFIAPQDSTRFLSQLSIAQQKKHQQKITKANQIRINTHQWKKYFLEAPQNQQEILTIAKSNYQEIKNFLSKEFIDLRLKMLSNLSEKDIREITSEVLEDHFQNAIPYQKEFPEEIFNSYLLSPKIEMEEITSYRNEILTCFTKKEKDKIKKDPTTLIQWISQNIQTTTHEDYHALITPPIKLLQAKKGNQRSINILYIAIWRSLGIPSRLIADSSLLEYYSNHHWNAISPTKTYQVKINNTSKTEAAYQQNWHISKIEQEKFISINQQNEFAQTFFLSPGNYRLITITRLPNGNQLAYQKFFQISDASIEIDLKFRQPQKQDIICQQNFEAFQLQNNDQKFISSTQFLTNPTNILFWLEINQEPTEHLLNELLNNKNKLLSFNIPIFFILKNKNSCQNAAIKKIMTTFPKAVILYDQNFIQAEKLSRRLYVAPDKHPLIILTQQDHLCLYAHSGYQVGTVLLLIQILNFYQKIKK